MSASLRTRTAQGLRLLGAWLHPETSHRRGTAPERRTQLHAGIVATAGIAAWATAVLLGLAHLLLAPQDASGQDGTRWTLALAVALVLVSVFAPSPIFRTRNAARTRQLLDSPSAPIPPWHASTITIDAVLVGGMVAGLSFQPWLMLTLMALVMLARLTTDVRRRLPADPNARFHVLTECAAAGAVATSASVIVAPLAPSVAHDRSPVPMVLAGIVAMLVGVAFNAVQRWVVDVRVPWGLLRDLTDTRRLIVVLTCAALAWLVAWVEAVRSEALDATGAPGMGLIGLGVLVAGWLALCSAASAIWRRDASRTLELWQQHQAQIVIRLADGSLHPDLARRAALPTVARMAVAVFGATRAMAVLDDGRGGITSAMVAAERYEQAPAIDAASLAVSPHLHLHCFPSPVQSNATGVTIAAWLWPGWLMTRSPALVERFTGLATLTLLTPTVADGEGGDATSFDAMFDPVHRWPTLAAFGQAIDRMRARADASPHSDSLIIAVYAIDDFGALSGGRFEQAAVAQVVRLALGHEDFMGHDVFVAYEAPGRIWVALAGGPIIRSGISLLRGLQTRINDHGAVPAQHADIDVHVSVSFGYAAHQVDDFTREGLMSTSIARLNADADARNPFAVESLLTYNIRPEDIIGQPDSPMTTVHMLDQLRSRQDPDDLLLEVLPVVDTVTQQPTALMCSVGWNRTLGNVDLSSANAFAMVVNRQADLAAVATDIAIDHIVAVMDEADACGMREAMVMATMPSVLLHPEAGHLALPNLMSPRLDRRQCARTVVLFDEIPLGAGQALRVLADRGISIAVTAAAAAGADAGDLFGWQRWAIVLPSQLLQGEHGVDALTIQQTVTAIATRGTHLIGQVDRHANGRELARHGISWTMEPDHSCAGVQALLAGISSRAAELA